nr:MAG TPA: hypothetical protein [Caudoviricetes sp.]
MALDFSSVINALRSSGPIFWAYSKISFISSVSSPSPAGSFFVPMSSSTVMPK